MSVEPMDREEREALLSLAHSASGQVPWEDLERYEATVQAVADERAEWMTRALEAEEKRNAIARRMEALRQFIWEWVLDVPDEVTK